MPSITNILRLFAALALAMVSLPLLLASSASAAPTDKVVVCKYVNTPGGTLDHIVVVDESTLGNATDPFPGTLPFQWTDAHGGTLIGSIAVRYATEGEQAHDVAVEECNIAPVDECPQLDGDQEPGFQCVALNETETRDLGPLLDCDAGTITTLHQERSRTQTFNADTQEWEWGAFSEWETVDSTVVDATEEDCPVDVPIDPVIDPPVDPPVDPVLPNTGSSPYLTALALMGGLLLTAGSAVFMRSRKVRVPRA